MQCDSSHANSNGHFKVHNIIILMSDDDVGKWLLKQNCLAIGKRLTLVVILEPPPDLQ